MTWLILSALLAFMRLDGVTHIAFQAAAHLYVGGMIIAAVKTRKPVYWAHVIVLSVIETLVALRIV